MRQACSKVCGHMFTCYDILLYMCGYCTVLYIYVLMLLYTPGMFKYQHVSTGSKLYIIINCPRVACPFDREQQVRPTHTHTHTHTQYCNYPTGSLVP